MKLHWSVEDELRNQCAIPRENQQGSSLESSWRLKRRVGALHAVMCPDPRTAHDFSISTLQTGKEGNDRDSLDRIPISSFRVVCELRFGNES
jgi:hypothetical protein